MIYLKTLETIQSYFESAPSYTADPHTAVGLAAAKIIASQKYVIGVLLRIGQSDHNFCTFLALHRQSKLYYRRRTRRSSRKPSPEPCSPVPILTSNAMSYQK